MKLRFKRHDIYSFLACVCALVPCYFSDLMNLYGTAGMLLFYGMAIIFGLCSNIHFRLESWKLQALLMWGVVLVLCLLNRNGDLQRGSYSNIINLFFIVIFCVIFVFRDDDFLKNFLKVTVIFLTIHLVFGFYFMANPSKLISFGKKYFSLGNTFSSKFLSFVNAGAFMGITSHYSTSGMYMAVAVIVVAAFIFACRSRYKKWNMPAMTLFVFFFVALVLTQKRAQLLFSVVAIILMYLVGYVKGNLNKRILQIFVGALLLTIAFLVFLNIPAFQTTILRYISGGNLDEVSSGRISQLWAPALNELIEHPFLGIGWRQFKYTHQMNNGVSNDVHNIYLQLLAENGIFAGVYVIILMVHAYVSTWKMLRICKNQNELDDYLFLLFSFGYQTFFLLYGLTGNPFYEVSCLFPYFVSCCICYKYSAEHGYNRVMIKMAATSGRI